MKSINELSAIREQEKKHLRLRTAEHAHTRVEVHMGTCGIEAGAREVLIAFAQEMERLGKEDVMVVAAGCGGICRLEPMATVTTPDGMRTTYVRLTPERAAHIAAAHIAGGQPVREYTIGAAD